jgi:hypothetical protein
MSRRDSQALAEIVAWIAGRPRPRLRSRAARFDEKSGHTADPAVRAGIAGSTADLGAEIVADDDADNTTIAGEAGGTLLRSMLAAAEEALEDPPADPDDAFIRAEQHGELDAIRLVVPAGILWELEKHCGLLGEKVMFSIRSIMPA